MKLFKIYIFFVLIGLTIYQSAYAQQDAPVATPDVFTIPPVASIDVTANDYDVNGDPFWIKEINIGTCPAGSITPAVDGMVDIESAGFNASCEFFYTLTSINLLGREDDSNQTSVTLIRSDKEGQLNFSRYLLWTDSDDGNYDNPSNSIDYGELTTDDPAITETFTIKNNASLASGITFDMGISMDLNDPNLSLGNHNFPNGDLSATLEPQESLFFELIVDPQVGGEINGNLSLSANVGNERIDRLIHLSGEVIDTCVQQAYTTINIPSIIQAEGYDICGYLDHSAGNTAPPIRVRPDEGVDVRQFHNREAVTQVETGEWMDFTINNTQLGIYTVHVRFSQADDISEDGDLTLVINYMDGVNPTVVPIELTNIAGGENFFHREVIHNVFIESQVASIRLQVGNRANYNLDEINFKYAHDLTPPQAEGDELTVLGDSTEHFISVNYLLSNDTFDPYLLDPWDYQSPDIQLINDNDDEPVATFVDDTNKVIRIDLSSFSNAGNHPDIFKYQLIQGGLESNIVGMSLEIDPDAVLIQANDDIIELGTSSTRYSIGHLDLTHNDSAENGNVRISGVSEPDCVGIISDCAGVATFLGQGINYTPDPRVNVNGGKDHFIYEVTSTSGSGTTQITETDTANIDIYFYEPPIANNDFTENPLEIQTHDSIQLDLDEVLANDVINYFPTQIVAELIIPDGMQVIYDDVEQILNITFTRPGQYQLGYLLLDGLGQYSNEAFISIDAFNDPPIAQPDSYAVETGVSATLPVELNVVDNDYDSNGDSLTINDVQMESRYGSVRINNNLKGLIYTPPANARFNRFTLNYTVTDGNATSTALVNIDVNVTSPVGISDVIEVRSSRFETSRIDIAELLKNDTGSVVFIDVDSLDFPAVNGDVYNLVYPGISQDTLPTAIDFTPGSSQSLPTTFTYRIKDRFGQLSNETDVTLVAQ